MRSKVSIRSFLLFSIMHLLVLDINSQDRNPIGIISSYLSGHWESNPEACVGIGEADRINRIVLDSNFFSMETKAAFDVKKNNRHEDKKFISYDKLNRKLALREFHSEGFVNTFEIDSLSTDLKYLRFLSTSLENVPVGWRARVILEVINKNSYREIFDLAKSEEPYQTYVIAHWVRTFREFKLE